MANPGASAPTLVVVGSLNMDLVFRAPRAPEAGETLIGYSFTTAHGGKGANQAVACARLGAKVSHVGRVGADAFGRQLKDALAADGIEVQHISVDAEAATGTAMILVDDQAQNRIVLAPGANARLAAAHLQEALTSIEAAALMILQLEVPLPSVEAAIALARQSRCPVLLNPAPAQQLPDHVWPAIDYLIPNETEASLLTGVSVGDVASASEAAAILRQRGVKTVLITLGSQGVLIADDQGVRHLPAHPVKAVDTTAAGDTFIGGFAVGRLEGMSVDDAARLGQRAAALCVSRAGAQPSIPYRSEL